MRRQRVVVTGVGLVTPLGVGVQAVWPRLLAGKCGIRRVDALSGLPSQVAGTVPRLADAEAGSTKDVGCAFDASNCRFIGRGDEVSLAMFSQFALAAAQEALDSAKWDPQSDEERERTGVAIGSGIGALEDIVGAADAMKERGHRRVSPYFVPRMLVNMAAGQVSIRAGLRGPLAAPATACATGANAIVDAANMLSNGAADVVLAGGAESCITPLAVAGFSRMRALSTQFNDTPQAASRPFDARRDGFVLGEGAAVLTLETAEHARARNAPILAELAGFGMSADAHHITKPPGDANGALRAMRMAVQSATDGDAGGLSIDYVNAHATSTPAGDDAELRAIAALAAELASPAPILVSSTKGATGHLLGAAGAVEAAFTVLALHHQQVPPTINLEAPNPPPTDVTGVGHVTLDDPASERPLKGALCNSFGFGGVNVSLLFRRANQP
jgi:3-oxoacyl-[acyl-carrier-protein] synthase II